MGAEDYAPDSLPAAQHLLNDLHLNNAENQGANTDKAASAKTHKEHAEELKDYIKKRIELFDQYKSREDAQVDQSLVQRQLILGDGGLVKMVCAYV